MMQKIFDDYTIILTFLIICIIINMVFDTETLNSFLTIVLISIVIINSKKISSLMRKAV